MTCAEPVSGRHSRRSYSQKRQSPALQGFVLAAKQPEYR